MVQALGRLTAMVMLVAGAGALFVGVKSLPDIQRYLRMRSM